VTCNALRRFFSTTAMVAFLVSPASAQSGAVEGIGSASCADLITARDSDDSAAYHALGLWLSGYMTARNVHSDDTFDLTPWQPMEAALAQIGQFCTQNTEAQFLAATEAYIAFLAPDRLTQASPLIQARNGEQAVFIYGAVLETVKDRLMILGLLEAGAPEGFDAATGQALLRYQQRNALTQTGLPDLPTLALLLRKTPG